jgi:RNA:NAD 2'-phosphotransferase (TPT1/KptA family)
MLTFLQFISEGTKYLYHGTSKARLESIRNDGYI